MAATATARRSTAARRLQPRRAPARKPAPARAATPAGRRRRTGHTPITGFVPVAAAAGAVGGIADSGLFVWLTRGRLWIALLGTMLVGIVGLNVMALSFSSSSSNAGQAADSLRRENSALRAQVANRLSNSEVQEVAAKLGLVMPGPGSIGYVRSSGKDAKIAAERLRNGELTHGSAAAAVAPVDPTLAAPVEAVPVATDPAATTDPAAATEPAAVAPAPADPAAVAPVDPAAAPTTAPVTTAPPAEPATGGAVGAP